MQAYIGTVEDFLKQTDDDHKAEAFIEILQAGYEKMNLESEEPLKNSWKYSVTRAMRFVLNRPDIDRKIGVAIEYNKSGISGSIDMALTGRNSNGQDVMMIIELKQWTMKKNPDEEIEKPCRQIMEYHDNLMVNAGDYLKSSTLFTAVYLHNYEKPEKSPVSSKSALRNVRVFYNGEKNEFAKYIAMAIPHGDEGALFEKLDSIMEPSQLERSSSEYILKSLHLSEDQADAVRIISEEVRKAYETGKKKTIIVNGACGTGKTVVARYLIAYLTSEYFKDCPVHPYYIAKSSALRNHIIKTEAVENTRVRYQDQVRSIRTKNNVIIVDEAHRLTAYPDSQPVSKDGKQDTILRTILSNSLVSVFMIDEKQVISLDDALTVQTIRKNCYGQQLYKPVIELKTQFRNDYDYDYSDIVETLLGEKTEDEIRGVLSDYDLIVYYDEDTESRPQFSLFYDDVKHLNESENAGRIVASQCRSWEWVSRKKPEKNDFAIGSHKLRWNDKNDPGWMDSENGFESIGCIHTAQGLETEHIGVIIGEDLLFRNGKIMPVPENRSKDDSTVNTAAKNRYLERYTSITPLDDDDSKDKYSRSLSKRLREIVINTYRVLLTRGRTTCRIYCMDPDLGRYMQSVAERHIDPRGTITGNHRSLKKYVHMNASKDLPYLFVSYSHSDTGRIRTYLDHFLAANVRTWLDPGIEAGTYWSEVLKERILSSKGIILFVSGDSLSSEFVQKEIITAHENNIPIYPVHIEYVKYDSQGIVYKYSEVPQILNQIQYIGWNDHIDTVQQTRECIEAVTPLGVRYKDPLEQE